MGVLEDLVIVGFDANDEAVASVQVGEMSASVAQAPSEMGRLAVVHALRHLRGEAVPKVVDTGSLLVTRDSLP